MFAEQQHQPLHRFAQQNQSPQLQLLNQRAAQQLATQAVVATAATSQHGVQAAASGSVEAVI
jgi:hypothetical protein